MTIKPMILAMSVLSLAAVASPTDAQHRVRHRYVHAAPGYVAEAPERIPYAAPGPHMVQIKPGYWISSWGCVTDEGGGRVKPCDAKP